MLDETVGLGFCGADSSERPGRDGERRTETALASENGKALRAGDAIQPPGQWVERLDLSRDSSPVSGAKEVSFVRDDPERARCRSPYRTGLTLMRAATHANVVQRRPRSCGIG